MKYTTSLIQKILLVLFGFALSLLITKVCLRAGGVIYRYSIEQRNRIALRQAGGYQIMFLGESTTAEGGQDSYPRQLGRILNQKLPGIKFTIINKGLPGVYTSYILTNLKENLNKYDPDMVVVMMGINDEKDIPGKLAGRIKNFIKGQRLYKLVGFVWMRLHEKGILKDIYLQRARYYREEQNFYMTARMYKRALEVAPGDYEVYLEFGRYYQELWDNLNAEIMFKKAIEAAPRNYSVYLEIARYYQDVEDHSKAENFYNKAIQLNPNNYILYLELAGYYHGLKDYSKAEGMLNKVIEAAPQNYESYLNIARYYQDIEDHHTAEVMFRKALELNPGGYTIYLDFGNYYESKKDYFNAEAAYKKATGVGPDNYDTWNELGKFYKNRGNIAESIEMFKKAILIDPEASSAYINLAWCYVSQGNSFEAYKIFRKAVDIDPRADISEYDLKLYCQNAQKTNDSITAKELEKRIKEIFQNRSDYSRSTVENYRSLKNMVLAKNIKLVCVQYPRRELKPLRKMLGSSGDIIYVDNEEIFNQAVQNGRYDDYFLDRFAGDFGHCTIKGNYLLAENTANVLLKEVFMKVLRR